MFFFIQNRVVYFNNAKKVEQQPNYTTIQLKIYNIVSFAMLSIFIEYPYFCQFHKWKDRVRNRVESSNVFLLERMKHSI